ncbi:MAG TPA: hypothetical protein VJP59_03955, partial [Gemmatimonadota bacterium]|nr:hypothetical protein [Gemmatimonadota bacterium]
MHSRRRSIAIAHLIVLAAMVLPARTIRAQRSVEIEERAVVLRRLIFDVEVLRRVLVRSRG